MPSKLHLEAGQASPIRLLIVAEYKTTSGRLSRLTLRYDAADGSQGCRSVRGGMKIRSGKCGSSIFNVRLFLLSQPSHSGEPRSS